MGRSSRETIGERSRTHGATVGSHLSRSNVSKEYQTWARIKNRCHSLTAKQYADYGGRGIFVCDEWRHDYSAFLRDMGPAPSPSHSIDRIDNDGPYSPDNCRWATPAEQAMNRRNNVMVSIDGAPVRLIELARKHGVNYHTLYTAILVRGDTAEAAIARLTSLSQSGRSPWRRSARSGPSRRPDPRLQFRPR